ncbi:MAG: hypothetical protein AAF562_10800 [Pseudomonadota bacterium]
MGIVFKLALLECRAAHGHILTMSNYAKQNARIERFRQKQRRHDKVNVFVAISMLVGIAVAMMMPGLTTPIGIYLLLALLYLVTFGQR